VKGYKKVIWLLLIMILVTQLHIMGSVHADVYPPQSAPQRLRVDESSEKPIGYNEFDKYYIDLWWDSLVLPPVADNGYINFYLQEINKPYRPAKPLEKKETDLPGALTNLRMKNLNSGTIYYTHARAYYTFADGGSTYISAESEPSNTVKFLTDIAINAYAYGSKQIKIEWDDVWNLGKRIDYKLYVSESRDFSNTPPIYINQEMIGPNRPVKVNETTGKLEYIHTVRDPGRVYYIKIVPDIADDELKRSAESDVLAVSSFILAKTSKMFTTEAGTVWRLDWSRVVTGLGDSDIKISYHIYKGYTGSDTVPQYMAAVDSNTFFVTIPPGEDNSYFIIRAIVTRNGEDVYPGIKIESDKIFVAESEVPAYPPVPELVDEFTSAGVTIISYKDELTPNSVTILWRAPRKGSGQIDEDITYDIWFIEDPNQIDDPPEGAKIESSLKMTEENFVKSGDILVGYKYVIENLTPNSTYYFKIAAGKTYIEVVEDTLESVTYYSDTALKVIITPPEGPIDQPVVPGRPPLTVKKTPPPQSRDMVSETTAVIQIKNKWYEEYVDGNWVYRTPEQLGDDIVADIENGTADPLVYRTVQYDAGVTIDVGCIEYQEGMVYEDLKLIPANKVTGFPVEANDPYEDAGKNPDGKRHNVDITLTGLKPNTTYIIWARAARRSVGLVSGPSDPIIITTDPVIDVPVEKPTVPVFNYSYAGDTYVDLGWDFKAGYTYHIKYGQVDDINLSSDGITVTPEDLIDSNYLRVRWLSSNTLYYFWIQAQAVNESGQTILSEWSDSYLVKTLPDKPPATPRGFGVKNQEDAVTKNSITFEWIKEDEAEYILEIASDIDYKDAKEYTVADASEFTVEGLRSNHRYYARLYAYDPSRQLRSNPTQSITVRTRRSSDDYDSDEDIESIVSGDYIVKDKVIIDGTWNIRITGINADRLIEHIRSDKVIDYKIDLSNPPAGAKRITLLLSSKVINALSGLKENLIIAGPDNMLVLGPGVLYPGTNDSAVGRTGEFNYEITIILDGSMPDTGSDNLKLKTKITGIEVNTYEGGNTTPLTSFSRPLKVVFIYQSENWYREGITSGYIYEDGLSRWKKAEASASYDEDNRLGRLAFEINKAGYFVVAEPGDKYFEDIERHWAKSSIIKVASMHKLKSISGKKFYPERFATIGDSVKFMLDVLDYDYSSDYMTAAVRAGLVSRDDHGSAGAECTREKAIMMAVRVYELKSGEKAVPPAYSLNLYEDMNRVSPAALPKIKFAAESGIIISRFENILGPKDPVTRAELMVLIEKVMVLAGEISGI
jgi:hypothetical protein